MSASSRTGFSLLDDRPAAEVERPSSLPVSVARPVRQPTLLRRSLYKESPNLKSLALAEDQDSYFSQALSRHAELVWKKGYTLESENEAAAKYIELRFSGMEMAMDRPIMELLQNVTRHFIHYGEVNLVLKRARNMKLPPVPGVFTIGVGGRTPIVALFEMDPTTVTPNKDTDGNVVSYTQSVDGQSKDFDRRDIINFAYRRRPHEARGRSFLSPVLGDLDAFRIMEDRFMLLLQKYLFPLTLYRVGVGRQRKVPDTEIQKAIATLHAMAPDATLVVEGDHEIQSTGAESKAIRAEGYAKIFQNRLFAGLGMSELQFGIGQNISRNSGELITAELHDKILAWQMLLDLYLSFYVIRELLLEGGFDPVNRPEDRVFFQFPPLSDEEKYRSNANAVLLWQNDGCTIDQYWRMTRQKPPTDKDWRRTRFSLVSKPLAELAAKSRVPPGSAGGSSDGAAGNTSNPQNQYTNSMEQDDPTTDFMVNAITTLVNAVESLRQDVQRIEESV